MYFTYIFMYLLIFICYYSELDESKQINRDKPVLKKQINYEEYVERMHLLSQNRRNEIYHKKKGYCDYIPDILKESNLPIIHSPSKPKKYQGLLKGGR